ncbi:MAG: FTR1 family protein [Pseudomonadota bacterium]|nr:FTR1 family protein [Pseudomonadota bacterium]
MKKIILAVLLFLAPAVAAGQSVETRAQTIVHLLAYISVDYPEFVKGGKVLDGAEYQEQLEFSSQVIMSLQSLPDVAATQGLLAKAQTLKAQIADKAAGKQVSRLANELRWDVIRASDIAVVPKTAPDLSQPAAIYTADCAGCHGVEGRGDGPLAQGLDPAPSNFHDQERMASRSVYGLYNTISLGVAGTAMRRFGELSEHDRWALAFYVASIGVPQPEVNEGKHAWETGEARDAFPDLSNLVTLSANEVTERYGENAALAQDHLIAEPQALAATKPSPLAFSRAKLEEALAAYRSGNADLARQLAITVYLEGFELIEASLDNVDFNLRVEIEREMMLLRNSIGSGARSAEVESRIAQLDELLARAEKRLGAGSLSPTTAFVSSLIILLREGVEAILVLAAIIAFVVKTGRRDALPWVHAGWIVALILGAFTWFAATYLIDISGANRELTEGVTALVAAAMLIYVGYWLHGKSYAQAWSRFIRQQVGAALSKGTLAAMALVSFLAVYRELFEIVLFYQPLWVQAAASGRGSVVAGIGVAAILLAAIGFAIFKYSVRLPIGRFFAITSLLIALLAVVFAGHGIAALQEAGVIDVNPVPFVSLPLLGIYPTAKSLAAQAFALALVALTFWLARREGVKPIASKV